VRHWISVSDLANWCAAMSTTVGITEQEKARDLALGSLAASIRAGEFEGEYALGFAILPETPMAHTASGGLHLYFAPPEAVEIACTEGERGKGIGPGLDTDLGVHATWRRRFLAPSKPACAIRARRAVPDRIWDTDPDLHRQADAERDRHRQGNGRNGDELVCIAATPHAITDIPPRQWAYGQFLMFGEATRSAPSTAAARAHMLPQSPYR
jgi:hypothetical protein